MCEWELDWNPHALKHSLAFSFVNCSIGALSKFLQLFVGICFSKLRACRLKEEREDEFSTSEKNITEDITHL